MILLRSSALVPQQQYSILITAVTVFEEIHGPIELSDKAVEILLELKDFYKRKGIESEWFFTHKTEKIHYRAIDLRIRKYCETAGISIKSMHKCRATFVSILRDAGMSFEKIAEIVGHKQIQTTMNNYSYDVSTDEENRKMLNSALDF